MTEVKDGVKYTNLGMKDGKFRYFKQNGTIAYMYIPNRSATNSHVFHGP